MEADADDRVRRTRMPSVTVALALLSLAATLAGCSSSSGDASRTPSKRSTATTRRATTTTSTTTTIPPTTTTTIAPGYSLTAAAVDAIRQCVQREAEAARLLATGSRESGVQKADREARCQAADAAINAQSPFGQPVPPRLISVKLSDYGLAIAFAVLVGDPVPLSPEDADIRASGSWAGEVEALLAQVKVTP